MVHHESRGRFAATQLHAILNAPSAAELSRARRAFAQRRLLEQHWIVRLEHLEGLRLGEGDGGAGVGVAVARPVPAVAAAAEVVHDIVAPMLGVVAAETEVAGGAEGPGVRALRQGAAECAEDGLDHALRAFRGRARHRPRVLGVQERAFRLLDVDRLEPAGVERNVREHVPHADVDRGLGGRERRIHGAAARRAAAREVEVQVRSLDLEVEAHPQRIVANAVAVHRRFEAVPAVGQRLDMRTHLHLGAPAHVGDHRLDHVHAVTVEEHRQAPLADIERSHLRLEVAHTLLRHAAVGEDQCQEVLVQLALARDADGRQAQPLLMHLPRVAGKAACDRPADIRPVRRVGKPCP